MLNANNLSKWYGNVQGISEVSLEVAPGILGLLGPNGAGKSTFLKIATGQLKPNLGELTILGEKVFNHPDLFLKIGFCSEYDTYYKGVSGLDMLTFFAGIHGIRGAARKQKAVESLDRVGLKDAGNKKVSAYSLGMRQRLKLAVSILHDPEIIILDEPLRGVDPLWRSKIISMIRTFGEEGRTVIVSSHILSEIEAMTDNIVLIHQGKIFAHGNIQEIRNLIDSHPHQISIRCNDARKLGKDLISLLNVISIQFDDDGEGMVCTTNHRDDFYTNLMRLIVTKKLDVSEISSADDNLQAVFNYLIERK